MPGAKRCGSVTPRSTCISTATNSSPSLVGPRPVATHRVLELRSRDKGLIARQLVGDRQAFDGVVEGVQISRSRRQAHKNSDLGRQPASECVSCGLP